MTRSTSDTGVAETIPTGPPANELVTVTHPEHGTDEVPLDAALALEAQKTGWVRDDKAKIGQLERRIAELEAERDALKAAVPADTPQEAAKATRPRSTEPKGSDTPQEG